MVKKGGKQFLSQQPQQPSHSSQLQPLHSTQPHQTSPLSQTFSQSQSDPLPAGDLEKLTCDLVVYFLFKEESKIPVKRADITKDLGKINTKSLNIALNEAKKILSKDFGFYLATVDHHSSKQFFLVNKLKTSKHLHVPEERKPHQVLLSIVLSYIFMKGGVVSDTALWNFLTSLKIIQDQKNVHPYFGDVRKLLTVDYVRQLYLDYQSIPNTDPTKYEFRIGHRSKLEVNFKELLDFFCQMYGADPRKKWKSQQREAEKMDEEQKAQIMGDDNELQE